MSDSSQESGTTEEMTWVEALSESAKSLSEEPKPESDSDTSETELAADSDSDVTPDAEGAETVEASEEEPLQPLERWSDEQKERFGSLDRQAQQFLLDRHKELEGDYTRKTQELSETQRRYEGLDKVLSPYREAFERRGIDIAPHVASALQAYVAFQSNPAETLKSLIQTANLTQEQLFEDPNADPAIGALRTELQQARREIAELKRQPQTEEVESLRQIEEFQSAKDGEGNLKYPHFESVRPIMAPLVGKGMSLEDAYNEAVWSLPDYRQAQLEAERKKSQKELQAKQAKKVNEAKKASETLPSSDVDAAGNSQSDFTGWGDALQETLSQLRS